MKYKYHNVIIVTITLKTLNKIVLNPHTYLCKRIKCKIIHNISAKEEIKASKNLKIIILQYQNLNGIAIHIFLLVFHLWYSIDTKD